jgi:hypothetical protein
MRLTQWPVKILLIVALATLTGCTATPTPTFTFQRTRTTRVPTDTAVPSTPVPTSTPAPTDTPNPTPTNASGSLTPTNAAGSSTSTANPAVADTNCNAAEFAGNVNYFDGTKVGPDHPFTKSWLIRNTGTCTWNSDYTLVYVNGTRFGGDTAVSIPGPIAPGQYVTVSANLVAPNPPGTYTSYWMMKDDSNQFFGFGPVGKDPIHVTILIMQLGSNTNPTPKP